MKTIPGINSSGEIMDRCGSYCKCMECIGRNNLEIYERCRVRVADSPVLYNVHDWLHVAFNRWLAIPVRGGIVHTWHSNQMIFPG